MGLFQDITTILNYPALANVKKLLETGYVIERVLVPYKPPYSYGLNIIKEILSDYDPNREIINTEIRLTQIFDSYEDLVLIREIDRTILANIAHMIWVELQSEPKALWAIHSIVSWIRGWIIEALIPERYLMFLGQPRMRWSLRDLTTELVDDYILGPIYKYRLKSYAATHKPSYYYNFMFYPIAIEIMTRMKGAYPDIFNNPQVAIARFVEYVGDRFLHQYEDPITKEVRLPKKTWPKSPTDYDKNSEEYFHDRVGGCQEPSLVMAALARSINIPSRAGYPIICDELSPADTRSGEQSRRDAHCWVEYPAIKSLNKPAQWVHGDSVVLPTGIGILGEVMFQDYHKDIYDPQAKFLDKSIKVLFQRAKKLCAKAKKDHIGKWRCGFPDEQCLGLASDSARTLIGYRAYPGRIGGYYSSLDPKYKNYLKARFGFFNPKIVAQTMPSGFRVDTIVLCPTKYKLLKDVAAYWPLDGTWLRKNRIREASLNGLHGRFTSPFTCITTPGIRDNGLMFWGYDYVTVDDHSALMRNDEELSISLWVKWLPLTSEITLIERVLTKRPGYIAWGLYITKDGYIEFRYQTASRYKINSGQNPLRSSKKLAFNRWEHVAVTYDAFDQVAIYINGNKDNSKKLQHIPKLPRTIYIKEKTGDREIIVAAEIHIAGKGTNLICLDEIILYYPALTADEVRKLYNSY